MLAAAAVFDALSEPCDAVRGRPLMDFVTYVGGLSGGSWATALLFTTKSKNLRPDSMNGSPFHSPGRDTNYSTFTEHMSGPGFKRVMANMVLHGHHGITDWAAHLEEKIVHPTIGQRRPPYEPGEWRLDDFREAAADGSLPLFSCALIATNDGRDAYGGGRYDWVAIDPCLTIRCRAESDEYVSQTDTSLVPGELALLPNLLAGCGSAFAMDADVLRASLRGFGGLGKLASKFVTGGDANPSLTGLLGRITVNIDINGAKVCLRDAGIDNNVPFPLFMHPGFGMLTDILLVFDSSFEARGPEELARAVRQGYIEMDPSNALSAVWRDSEPSRLFLPKDPTLPAIIYVLGLTHHSTFTEAYSAENIQIYANSMKQRVRAVTAKLVDMIRGIACTPEVLQFEAPPRPLRGALELRSSLSVRYKELHPAIHLFEDDWAEFDELFTSLSIRDRARGPGIPDFQVQDLWDRVAGVSASFTVTLVGDPGGGKSSLMRYLARTQAFDTWPVDIVLLLPLSALSDALLQSPADLRILLSCSLGDVPLVEEIYNWINSQGGANRGRVLWLLDGFDEAAVYAENRTKIRDFLAVHLSSESMLMPTRIVSTRLSHAATKFLEGQTAVELQSWSIPQRTEFVEKYCRLHRGRSLEMVDKIRDFFHNGVGMQQFDGNPFMVHLLCSHIHFLQAPMPVTLTEALKDCVIRFIRREDAKRSDRKFAGRDNDTLYSDVVKQLGQKAWNRIVGMGRTTLCQTSPLFDWGLIILESVRPDGGDMPFRFVHQQIADFLAAAWVSTQESLPTDFGLRSNLTNFMTHYGALNIDMTNPPTVNPKVAEAVKNALILSIKAKWSDAARNLKHDSSYSMRLKVRQEMGLDACMAFLAATGGCRVPGQEITVQYFVLCQHIRSALMRWIHQTCLLMHLLAEVAGFYGCYSAVVCLGNQGPDVLKRCMLELRPGSNAGSRIAEYCSERGVVLTESDALRLLSLDLLRKRWNGLDGIKKKYLADIVRKDKCADVDPIIHLELLRASGVSSYVIGSREYPDAYIRTMTMIRGGVLQIFNVHIGSDGSRDFYDMTGLCREVEGLHLTYNHTDINTCLAIGKALRERDVPYRSSLSYFLSGCQSLTEVDCSGWTSLLEIGNDFLKECTSLTTLDCSSWTQLQSIGHRFLKGCQSLTTLKCGAWAQLMTIADDFLSGCSSLIALDCSSWREIMCIGDDFLFGCTSLKEIDCGGWEQLVSILNRFLGDCISLAAINCSGWVDIWSIGDDFLSGCSSLTTLDCSSWMGPRTIGSDFLCGCTLLKEIGCGGWGHLERISDRFLMNCSSLIAIDCRSWTHLVWIDDDFLRGCKELKTVDRNARTDFEYIGKHFMMDCHPSLKRGDVWLVKR
jgi:hypothetical protein